MTGFRVHWELTIWQCIAWSGNPIVHVNRVGLHAALFSCTVQIRPVKGCCCIQLKFVWTKISMQVELLQVEEMKSFFENLKFISIVKQCN